MLLGWALVENAMRYKEVECGKSLASLLRASQFAAKVEQSLKAADWLEYHWR
jgi:hypothetical protein